MKTKLKLLPAVAAIFVLSACGGGGGGGGGETLNGVFIDSAVQGVRWVAGDLSGTTDSAGTFQYKRGNTVEFYIGDILLGSATGDSVVMPLDLVDDANDISNATVTNIGRLLITLDNDGDPDNGIVITEAVVALAADETVDFAQSTTDFGNSGAIQVLVATLTGATDAGARDLVGVAAAQDHMEDSIADLLAGSYSGTFSGDSRGTWFGTINSSGVFSGTATDSEGERSSFLGTVSTNGSGSTDFETSGGVSDGTTFEGTFDPNGSASGTWTWFGEENGRWEGSKSD